MNHIYMIGYDMHELNPIEIFPPSGSYSSAVQRVGGAIGAPRPLASSVPWPPIIAIE